MMKGTSQQPPCLFSWHLSQDLSLVVLELMRFGEDYKMNEKQIEMITDYLDKIGEKLGVGANTIWPWLVKQQYVSAIMSIILFGLFWGAGVWICKMWNSKWTKYYKTNDVDALHVVHVFFTIGVTIGMMFSLGAFLAEFFDIFNPQYWALRDLLQIVRQ